MRPLGYRATLVGFEASRIGRWSSRSEQVGFMYPQGPQAEAHSVSQKVAIPTRIHLLHFVQGNTARQTHGDHNCEGMPLSLDSPAPTRIPRMASLLPQGLLSPPLSISVANLMLGRQLLPAESYF